MTISNEKIEHLERAAKKWISRHGNQHELGDLLNESVLVILENYAGCTAEGRSDFTVQYAVERLSRGLPELKNATGFEMDQVSGTSPSGVRNTDEDFVEQVEVDDWIEVELDLEQQAIVHCLIEGWTHGDIAHEMEVDRSTVTRKIQKIQEIAKETYDVN